MGKNVNIKIGSDTKTAERGIDKVAKALNKLAKNNTDKALGNLNGVVGLVSKSFKFAVDAIKKAWAAMNECSEAYKVQAKAEAALAEAAKGNPYLDGAVVQSLKAYASKLHVQRSPCNLQAAIRLAQCSPLFHLGVMGKEAAYWVQRSSLVCGQGAA